MNLYRFVHYDRSGRVAWLLCEMDLPFTTEEISFGEDGRFSESYLQKSPVGKVPALECDDSALFETGSILMRLCELHPEHGFLPDQNSPDRANYLNWFFLLTASFDSICFEFVRPDVRDPKEKAVRMSRSEQDIPRFLKAIDKQLADNPFMMGERFSIVDIQATGPLMYCLAHGALEDWPSLKSYLARMSQRTAVIKARPFRSDPS